MVAALCLAIALATATSADTGSTGGKTGNGDDSKRGTIARLIAASEAAQTRGDLVAAQSPLSRARTLASKSGDAGLVAAVLAAQGHLAMTLESPAKARLLLGEAASLAERAGAPDLVATIEIHIGNSHAIDALSQDDPDRQLAWRQAREAYQTALALIPASEPAAASPNTSPSPNRLLQAKVRSNLARSAVALTLPVAESEIEAATLAIEYVRAPSAQISLLLHLAETIAPAEAAPLSPSQRRNAHRAGSKALALAETNPDENAERFEALALLTLARLYRADDRPDDALVLLARAVDRAARADDPVARYRAQLATAEIQQARGNRDAALSAYAQALQEADLIRPLRARSYGLEPELSAEGLQTTHLAYVDLLLSRAAETVGDAPPILSRRNADLELAQRSLERQKAQELRDFFDDECVDAALREQVEAGLVDPRAAVVYPVALDDRLELIITSPKGRARASVPIGATELRETVLAFREQIEIRTHRRHIRPARKLYDWLIRPIEAQLESWDIETLVFVPDAALRAVPLAALHDGERYLVERYAIATTPGIDLTRPRPLAQPNRLALAGGLSVSREGFAALPYVEEEIAAVSEVLETSVLLNDAFTPPAMESGLASEPVSVLHIATHARFQSTEEAFVLTHDGPISMTTLSSYLGLFRDREQPLELLMLSACETASGDDEAALGLAGLAVQSGARSAIGTLWVVNDSAASEVTKRFYQGAFDVESPRSRALALAEAQRALLATRAYRHPAYWAPFLLIGNWL